MISIASGAGDVTAAIGYDDAGYEWQIPLMSLLPISHRQFSQASGKRRCPLRQVYLAAPPIHSCTTMFASQP